MIKDYEDKSEGFLFRDLNPKLSDPDYVLPRGLSYTLIPDHEIVMEGLIKPCISKKTEGGISFGLDPYGYSITLGNEWATLLTVEQNPRLFKESIESDPYNRPHVTMGMFKEENFLRSKADSVILYPGKFILAHTVEYIDMPEDVSGWVKDKSTNARCGLAVQNTVLEPGWRGQVTLEVTNHGPVPIKLLAGAGIAQIQFIRCVPCDNPYDGKYQDQKGVVLPRNDKSTMET